MKRCIEELLNYSVFFFVDWTDWFICNLLLWAIKGAAVRFDICGAGTQFLGHAHCACWDGMQQARKDEEARSYSARCYKRWRDSASVHDGRLFVTAKPTGRLKERVLTINTSLKKHAQRSNQLISWFPFTLPTRCGTLTGIRNRATDYCNTYGKSFSLEETKM